MGPLLLDVPVPGKVGFLNKNRKGLADKSNNSQDHERLLNGVGCGDSGLATWTSSFLLDEVILQISFSCVSIHKQICAHNHVICKVRNMS